MDAHVPREREDEVEKGELGGGSSEVPIRVLIADDDEGHRVLLTEFLRRSPDFRVETRAVADGRKALAALREEVFDVALLDLDMPDMDGLEVFQAIASDPTRAQVIFVSGRGTVAAATEAMKIGAYDFVEKPVHASRLNALVHRAAESHRLHTRSARLGALVRRGSGDPGIVTQDPRMHGVLEVVKRVAPSDVSVLVVGESGTGKELVARQIHRNSGREGEPLVALNCAAVPGALAESELFGHEKGAFTGAVDRKMGLVEMSDGGTLFLDEVGDMDASLQVKLLRTLESKRFRRVGGLQELTAAFRLVSATNRPLQDLVKSGRFRGDLYYRINAVVLELPPLRERPDDIPLLTRHFLEELHPSESEEWTITDDALKVLGAYAWPGNIRELRNVVERASIFAEGRVIRREDLGSSLTSGKRSGGGPGPSHGQPLPHLNLELLERRAIDEALEMCGWHQGDAADTLGISSRTLHRKIRKYGLIRPRNSY
ncbi:MAG: sigma-54 dependent transcriptional regulator [Gemmatimonadota bacterium]|nr:sigma-54 dependent transcriptional regulator [Gemmatimonadota bacterium]MDH5759172.1 sigma-54 dependent transcriptional regulator [Gemmatimonadota bacterium]